MIATRTKSQRDRRVVRIVSTDAQRTISRPAEVQQASQNVEISLGQRMRDWKTLAGFGISAAIIVFFILSAHLDPAMIWANVRSADVRYLVAALAVYFGAFV